MKEIIINSGKYSTKMIVSDEQYSRYWRPRWNENQRRRRNHKHFVKNGYSLVSYDAIDYNARSSFDVEDVVVKNERHAELVSALKMLDEDEYQLIVSTIIDGMSLSDYSKLTGIPRSTLSSRRSKILERLREQLS